MSRQYFYLVVCNYDETTIPCKIFLQEHEAISWGRKQATKSLAKTNDYNCSYVLYKQEITRTGLINLTNGKALTPYTTTKSSNPSNSIDGFDWENYKASIGSNLDIDKYRTKLAQKLLDCVCNL